MEGVKKSGKVNEATPYFVSGTQTNWRAVLTQANTERKEQKMAVLTDPWPKPEMGLSLILH